jgi:tetratricopeptide (TPR) repeat protein
VQCQWWRRRCLQQTHEAEGQVFGAVFASAGSKGPEANVLLSAACMRAGAAVVNGIVDMLTIPQATICGLIALNMIASEVDTRFWVWQKRTSVCRSVERAFFGHSTRLDCQSVAEQLILAEQVILASEVFRRIWWLEEALQLLQKLETLPVFSSGGLIDASCKASIILILQDLGRHAEALVKQKQVLGIQEAVLGERHPHVAHSRNNIGITLSNLDRHNEALVEQKAALDIQLAVLGECHRDVATSRINIGNSLAALGRHHEALLQRRAASEILLGVLGEHHPDVAERDDLCVAMAVRSTEETLTTFMTQTHPLN